MSSLTKQLIFFLVFSILSNFATSDTVKDCIDNVKEIFLDYNMPEIDFKIAMTAFSEDLLTLTFIWENAANLYPYFQRFDGLINNIGDKTFNSKHNEVLNYFEQHKYEKEHKNNSTIAKKKENIVDYIQSLVPKCDGDSDEIDFGKKQKYIVGYFQSLVDKLDNPNHPHISTWIDENTTSPQGFCEYRKYYDLSEVDIDTCNKTLCIMLNLGDDDQTQMENFINMTGTKAFKYCYLNYTYLDFSTDNLSSLAGSSSDLLHSRLDQDESSKQLQISIIIKYFSYLLDVSTKIVDKIHKRIDRQLFPTIDEYCTKAVESRS